jgi:hypothetical protein
LDPREPEDEDDERYDESDVRFRLIVGLTIKTISSTKFAVLDRIAAQGFHWNSQGRHFVLHGRRGGPDKIVYNNQLTLELEMLRMADYYGRAAVATGGTILIASHNMSKFMRIDDNGDGTFKMKKTVHYDGDRTDSVVISGEWLYKTMRNLAFALAPILEDEDCETAVEDEDYYDYDSESSDSSDSEW